MTRVAAAHRPFRLMAQVLGATLVAILVWVPLALVTEGFRAGPGEPVQFASLSEAREKGFADYGVAWPGSRSEIRGVAGGYVVERTWLGLTEVRFPLDENFFTDTAAYESGTGASVQDLIVALFAAAVGLLVFRKLRARGRASSTEANQGNPAML